MNPKAWSHHKQRQRKCSPMPHRTAIPCITHASKMPQDCHPMPQTCHSKCIPSHVTQDCHPMPQTMPQTMHTIAMRCPNMPQMPQDDLTHYTQCMRIAGYASNNASNNAHKCYARQGPSMPQMPQIDLNHCTQRMRIARGASSNASNNAQKCYARPKDAPNASESPQMA